MGGNLSSTRENNHNLENILNALENRSNQNTNQSNFNPNLVESFDYEPNLNHLLVEHQKSKKTKTYKNPIFLYKTSIKLERDSIRSNIFYVLFEYSSLMSFDVDIKLNHESNDEIPKIKLSNIEKDSEKIFFDKSFFIDVDCIYKNKQTNISKTDYDFTIELTAKKDNGEVECIFISYCNLIPLSPDGLKDSITYKVKCDLQKLKVGNYLFSIFNIYGMDPSIDSSSNDCEACCTKKKNTIFLPCKHSYSCSGCSVVVRFPNNQCPLCRQPVSDCLIID